MKKIDTKEWQSFPLSGDGGLFDVVKGKRLTKADMREGQINYVGASAMNNGITATISNDTYLHPDNTITVSYNGSIGEAFYQAETFWASDDVNVLYPRFTMTRRIAMFFIPLIRAVGKNYAFVDKWRKDQMEASYLLLPATPKGEPDFNYMENYIAELEGRVKQAVSLLVSTNSGGGNLIAAVWKPLHCQDERLFGVDGKRLHSSYQFHLARRFCNGATNFIEVKSGRRRISRLSFDSGRAVSHQQKQRADCQPSDLGSAIQGFSRSCGTA